MYIMNTTTDTTQRKTIGAEALRLSKLKDSSEKGRQFEKLLEYATPRIHELEVEQCWRWKNFPESIRSEVFSGTTKQDIGIDLVALLLDGSYVAIQAKSITRKEVECEGSQDCNWCDDMAKKCQPLLVNHNRGMDASRRTTIRRGLEYFACTIKMDRYPLEI